MTEAWMSTRIGYHGRYGRAVHRARRKAGLPTNRRRARDRRRFMGWTVEYAMEVQWTWGVDATLDVIQAP